MKVVVIVLGHVNSSSVISSSFIRDNSPTCNLVQRLLKVIDSASNSGSAFSLGQKWTLILGCKTCISSLAMDILSALPNTARPPNSDKVGLSPKPLQKLKF